VAVSNSKPELFGPRAAHLVQWFSSRAAVLNSFVPRFSVQNMRRGGPLTWRERPRPGTKDCGVVQEVIKEIASSHAITANPTRSFKVWFTVLQMVA
jgi:hypothetical protein